MQTLTMCMTAARARALQGPSRALWFLLLAEVFASASSQQLPMLRGAPACASVLQLKSASRKIGSLFTFWGPQVAIQHGAGEEIHDSAIGVKEIHDPAVGRLALGR